MYEHGSLQLYPHRRAGFGVLALTNSLAKDATPLAAPLALQALADTFRYTTLASLTLLPLLYMDLPFYGNRILISSSVPVDILGSLDDLGIFAHGGESCLADT